MGSDLYSVRATQKTERHVTIEIQCIHPDVTYGEIHDAGFALIMIYEAIPYGEDAPLNQEISFDDLLDQAWMLKHARGFVRDTRSSDVENQMPSGADRDSDHPYWEGQDWLSWHLDVEVSDPAWISHIEEGSRWESRAYSPSHVGYDDHDPILPSKGDELLEDTEGMFVWVPRECFSSMIEEWMQMARLLEMPAYGETYYVATPLAESDAIYSGMPALVDGKYSKEIGSIATIDGQRIGLANMRYGGYGYRSAERDEVLALRPKKKSLRGTPLAYSDILSRNMPVVVSDITCNSETRVTFTLQTSPLGDTIQVESASDALDLLLGSEWSRRDSELREPHSALTEALLVDGVGLEIEAVRRLREVIPFVTGTYISSFEIKDTHVQGHITLDELSRLSHEQVEEALLEPWPTTTVEVQVTDPRWIEHLRDGGQPFALRDRALAKPCPPPEREDPLADLPPAPDERVVLWREDGKRMRWIAERRGDEVIKRWGQLSQDRVKQSSKSFASAQSATKHLAGQVKKKVAEGYRQLMSDEQAIEHLERDFGLTFLDPRVLIIEGTRDPAQQASDMSKFRPKDVVEGVGVMGGYYTRALTIAEFAEALALKPGPKVSDYVWFNRPATGSTTSLNLPMPEPPTQQEEEPEQAAESSSRGIDLGQVEQIGSLTAPLTDEEWEEALSDHHAFLDEGCGGGSWMMLCAEGLPITVYQGPEADEGEQFNGMLKNIAGRDMTGARLDWANLSGVHAPKCVFADASLVDVAMTDAILREADFSGATMTRIDLSGSALEGANFSGADLTDADFEACDLTGADFSGARVEGASFKDAILEDVTLPSRS